MAAFFIYPFTESEKRSFFSFGMRENQIYFLGKEAYVGNAK